MAIIHRIKGLEIKIHPEARVAENVTLVGAVSLEEGASIWYGTVLRGDCGAITIGHNSVVEDNCVLHGEVMIGENCIIGHGAIVHHCTLGPGVLVGMGAIILSNAVIGEGSIIAAGAVVTEGTVIPPGSMVMGVPEKVKGPTTAEQREYTLDGVARYRVWAEEQLPTITESKESIK